MSHLSFNEHATKPAKPRVEFDPAAYLQYLDGMDVTDAEAREILFVLWDIMVQFVDLGFDADFQTRTASQMVIPTAPPEDSKTDIRTPTPDMGGHSL